MKKIAILGALLLSAVIARADLIGDAVTLAHYYPDSSSVYASATTTFAVGTSDVVSVGGLYSVDGEANTITLIPTAFGTWNSTGFNGFVISGIDDLITSVTVATNYVGWDDSRITFTGSSISANFSGLSVNSGTQFTLTVNQAVPDSGSMIAMLGGAMLGFAALRRKFVRA